MAADLTIPPNNRRRTARRARIEPDLWLYICAIGATLLIIYLTGR